jgi:selenide,water dikinase
VAVELNLAAVPFLPEAVEMAALGMLPAGSFANREYCAKTVSVAAGCDPIQRDLVFDAQTSGGMVLAVPEGKVATARRMLEDAGDLAAVIGRVVAATDGMARLRIL